MWGLRVLGWHRGYSIYAWIKCSAPDHGQNVILFPCALVTIIPRVTEASFFSLQLELWRSTSACDGCHDVPETTHNARDKLVDPQAPPTDACANPLDVTRQHDRPATRSFSAGDAQRNCGCAVEFVLDEPCSSNERRFVTDERRHKVALADVYGSQGNRSNLYMKVLDTHGDPAHHSDLYRRLSVLTTVATQIPPLIYISPQSFLQPDTYRHGRVCLTEFCYPGLRHLLLLVIVYRGTCSASLRSCTVLVIPMLHLLEKTRSPEMPSLRPLSPRYRRFCEPVIQCRSFSRVNAGVSDPNPTRRRHSAGETDGAPFCADRLLRNAEYLLYTLLARGHTESSFCW